MGLTGSELTARGPAYMSQFCDLEGGEGREWSYSGRQGLPLTVTCSRDPFLLLGLLHPALVGEQVVPILMQLDMPWAGWYPWEVHPLMKRNGGVDRGGAGMRGGRGNCKTKISRQIHKTSILDLFTLCVWVFCLRVCVCVCAHHTVRRNCAVPSGITKACEPPRGCWTRVLYNSAKCS